MTEVTAASARTRGVQPVGGCGHSRPVGLGPQRSTEHVLFRYDPGSTPPISFLSLPHGCTGGAETLDVTRKIYRSTMSGLLGAMRPELPRVVEHLEAVVDDMWVRTRWARCTATRSATGCYCKRYCQRARPRTRCGQTCSVLQRVKESRPSSSSSNPTTPSGLYWIRCEAQIPCWLFIAICETFLDG